MTEIMIDLFSVKLNGEYDDIGTVPTINEGLFLCDTTGEEYTRGYGYQIDNDGSVRMNQAADYKIQKAICPTIQSVCTWLNNWFAPAQPKQKNCCCDCLPYMPKIVIKTGDLVKAESEGICFVGYATVQDDVITVDNPLFNPEIQYIYSIINLPQDVEQAISQMIYYDVFTRGTVDGIKSETVGNYSYSLEDVSVGSLAYPSAIVSALDVNYRRLRFVQ